ncbi:hypothetical protein TNCV_2774761 [Trichonephila clavipes]|nr:hypothetical protein TNCV_2774761 [Trichonephila clavipes]
MLAKNFKKYLLDQDSLVASYEWIRGLFQDTPEGLSTSEEEIFIDFTFKIVLRGRGSVVVKFTNSWLAYHEFEPSLTEDTPSRGGRCTVSRSRLKRSSISNVEVIEEFRFILVT